MPAFAYTARDSAGLPVSGTMEAASAMEVSLQLRGQGRYPTSVQPVQDPLTAPVSARHSRLRLHRSDLIHVTTQLGVMTETGVTLVEALECIGGQAARPAVRELIEQLRTQVQAGSDFSAALARHPHCFPPMFIAMVRASEKSGMMSKLLLRAASYLRDEQDTLRRVRGALVYPAIMLSFAITTTTFLLAYVLPRFSAIYAARSARLPVPTRVLMAMSSFLVGQWIPLLVGIAVVAGALWMWLRTGTGQRTWHHVQLRIPLIGGIMRQLYLARGLRLLGTMASAGVQLVECVATTRELCDNALFQELWESVSEKIQNGRQFSEPLFQSGLVPRAVAQMLHSGEKSGKLAQVMEQVAGFSEQELKERIAELTRYIEPAMIILMGLIIGGVAMALLLPIFTISRVVAS